MQPPVKVIAILGANGQIGSFVHQCLRTKWPAVQIKACVRKTPGKNTLLEKDYMIFDPFADNWQSLGKVDVLINCIGIINEGKHGTFEQVHIGITKLILNNREKIGIPKIIQISALGANIQSPISFLTTKGKADELLLDSKNTVVIRPSIVCTPNTMLIQKLQLLCNISKYLFNFLPFPSTILQTTVQPIMPEDLAGIVAKLCVSNQHSRIINAVGPQILSIRNIIQLANKNISIIPVSTCLFKLIPLLLPSLLSQQQYELLLKNNTAEDSSAGTLEQGIRPTKIFFKLPMPL